MAFTLIFNQYNFFLFHFKHKCPTPWITNFCTKSQNKDILFYSIIHSFYLSVIFYLQPTLSCFFFFFWPSRKKSNTIRGFCQCLRSACDIILTVSGLWDDLFTFSVWGDCCCNCRQQTKQQKWHWWCHTPFYSLTGAVKCPVCTKSASRFDQVYLISAIECRSLWTCE